MANSNSIFDKLNEDINEESIAEDAYHSASSSHTVEVWWEKSEFSPKNFRCNNITKAITENLAAKYFYTEQRIYEPTDTLMICSASIKTCPMVFEDIVLDKEAYIGNAEEVLDKDSSVIKTKLEELKSKEYTSLLIYGHNEDYNDDFHSRLDKDFINMISRNFAHKYSRICLFGCFESVEGLKEVINEIYNRMSDQGLFSRIALYLDSNVRDDDGKWRSLANLINSGYIRPTVVDKQNLIEFVPKKFDKKMIARLFTKTIKVNTAKNLFDTVDIDPEEHKKVDDDDIDFFDDTEDLPF